MISLVMVLLLCFGLGLLALVSLKFVGLGILIYLVTEQESGGHDLFHLFDFQGDDFASHGFAPLFWIRVDNLV